MKIAFPEYSGLRCLMMPYRQGDADSVPTKYAAYRDIIQNVFIRKGDVGFLTIDESPVLAGAAHRGARAKHGRALHTEAGVVAHVSGWGSPAGWGSPSREIPTTGWGSPSIGWGTPYVPVERPRTPARRIRRRRPSPIPYVPQTPSVGWGMPTPATPGWGSVGWGARHSVTLDRDVRVLLANNLDDSCAIWDANHENTTEDGDIGHLASLYPYETATMMKAGEVHNIGIFTPHESLPVQQDYNRQFLRIVSSGVHGREPYFTENPLFPL